MAWHYGGFAVSCCAVLMGMVTHRSRADLSPVAPERIRDRERQRGELEEVVGHAAATERSRGRERRRGELEEAVGHAAATERSRGRQRWGGELEEASGRWAIVDEAA